MYLGGENCLNLNFWKKKLNAFSIKPTRLKQGREGAFPDNEFFQGEWSAKRCKAEISFLYETKGVNVQAL
jgi:hypothetical protein